MILEDKPLISEVVLSQRWRCSDPKDVSELELEGGRDSLCLLGLDLSGGDAHLKSYEGSGEVGRSGGGSEVVATTAAVAACCSCDAASTTAARSQEAAAAAWTVAMATAKSERATPEAANVTMMVLGSAGSGITMVEVGSGPESGLVPRADGPAQMG
jgi:hypothetical protein